MKTTSWFSCGFVGLATAVGDPQNARLEMRGWRCFQPRSGGGRLAIGVSRWDAVRKIALSKPPAGGDRGLVKHCDGALSHRLTPMARRPPPLTGLTGMLAINGALLAARRAQQKGENAIIPKPRILQPFSSPRPGPVATRRLVCPSGRGQSPFLGKAAETQVWSTTFFRQK
jgi:hypothetical protein